MISEKFRPLLGDYRSLLEEVDAWFARSVKGAGAHIRCSAGCSGCCRGMFDITLLDACLLKQGFEELPRAQRRKVLERSFSCLEWVRERWPGFGPPYLLNDRPKEAWDEIAAAAEKPCPLLSSEGGCLVYSFRPMTCRLHGLPLVDLSGEVFDEDWCPLNFPGTDPIHIPELRWEFRRLFERELSVFRSFSALAAGRPLHELDTFIALAVLIDFGQPSAVTGT